MISVVLFVFWPEEEELIEACLRTVDWADEIVILDNGATAKTLQIARKFTKKIFKDHTKDFAARHNLAKELAGGDWILYVDADERLSADLTREIQETIKDPQCAAYQLPRIHYFLGKEAKYGDYYPDYITRLFRKENLVGWTGRIHESSKVNGNIGRLKSPMYHLTHRDIYSMVRKTLDFSEHEARLRLEANHPPVVWWRLVRVFLSEFYIRIIKLQGWRGGTEGWIDGIFQAFSLFIVYARLWELQRKPPLEEAYKEIDKKILGEFK